VIAIIQIQIEIIILVAVGFFAAKKGVFSPEARRVMTNVSASQANGRAPINQFGNVSAFPTAAAKDVVSPNVDTLYSTAWLDVSREPIVLHVPDTKGRYYLMPMLDAWTNVFASPGKRTTGTKAHDFAIVGPAWHGKLPRGVTAIKAPTNMVWIIGRTQTEGPTDVAAVNQLQQQYRLTPLHLFGKAEYTPPADMAVDDTIDMKTPPPQQVAQLDGVAFFDRMKRL
jgi:hypothetical protein